MAEDPRTQNGETPSKRRLSLRLSGETTASDKKPRFESNGGFGTRNLGNSDYNSEADAPETATSSRFPHHSTSSYSSPTSSAGGDERDFQEQDRYDGHRHSRSRFPAHRRRPSFPPTWVTSDNDRQAAAQLGQSSMSSRPQSYHATPSASAAASRHSSPPPSFNLSSGQPLVNPPPKTQAAFVGKLYSMLEDDDIVKTGLIYWSAEGSTFTCPNPTEFSKTVLPRFFKHNNWQSFVRQLNMYSLVNDIYSTSTDPQAWEFRHSLFRRGEPHLLASIKRKSSRPSTHDGAQPISPTEEPPDAPKPVAGWMREGGPAAFRLTSPPPGPRVIFPYQNQNHNQNEGPRPASRGGLWESRQPGPPHSAQQQQRMLPPDTQPPQPQSQQPRFHPDPTRPPLSAQRFLPPAYPDGALCPPPSQVVSGDSLAGQVTVLEEKVQKLTEILNNDRVEHVRSNLDFTSYLLQMVGWAAGDQPSLEMKALQDTLNRVNGDMRQKYEALMASDALAIMASGAMNGRDRERVEAHERDRPGERDERRMRMPFEPPPSHPPRSIHAGLPNIRLPPNNDIPRGHTPRTSPLNRDFGELPPLARPPSGSGLDLGLGPNSGSGLPYDTFPNSSYSSNLPIPLTLSRSSNPNVSYFQPPPPLTPTALRTNGTRQSPVRSEGQKGSDDQQEGRRSMHPENEHRSRTKPDDSDLPKEEKPSLEDIKPRGGLRNLLN
ncbi:hypothetical protein I316_00372 [Kwoniella heveanensis BCC8398]|uniref:HSF-type DNA-binding domain-containing protein n=1 Tax=Kwoniella heveanensis BCC8398 TaxID=1296120 RepID=A0A1B9H4G1_9TREE|nr:hypothetical protein I316_00372 [Kwoniella heveanensis BCC8398]